MSASEADRRRGAGDQVSPAPRTVEESLERLERESWELYLDELRRLDDPPDAEDIGLDWDTPLGQFLRSDAGHPLGRGYPTGEPIGGQDARGGHRERWMAELRLDPCSFCGRLPAGTIDHIEPQSKAAPGEGHTWLNYAAACANCNASKADMPLLLFMWMRARRLSRRRLREEMRRAALAA